MRNEEDPPPPPPPEESAREVNKSGFPCSIMCFAKFFAVFNITLTGLASLTAVGTFVYCTVSIVVEIRNRGPPQIPPMDKDAQNMHDFFNIAICAGILVIVMFATIAFVFAIVLLNGVYKKKTNLIRAYFIYGIVVIVLCGVCGSTYLCLTGWRDTLSAAVAIIILFVYFVILAFIRMAYKQIESETVQYSPSSEVYMDPDEVCCHH